MANAQFDTGPGYTPPPKPPAYTGQPGTLGSKVFGEIQQIPFHVAAPKPNPWAIPDVVDGAATDPGPTGNQNPYGGIRTGGSGASKPDYSAWSKWAAAARPQDINLPDYNPPDFYDFDPSPYNTARQGVTSGIADARDRGNTAFDRSAAMYLDYQNPYAGGPVQYNPGTDPRLLASMQAWGGAGSYDAAQVNQEGVQADSAMGSVYDLLGRVSGQFNEGQLAGVEGDRQQLMQSLGGEERLMTLSINLKLAAAKAQHKKDEFEYGKEVADKRYDMEVAAIMANTSQNNQFNQGILDSILAMIGSQGKNIPTDPSEVMV